MPGDVPRLSRGETAQVVADVLAPLLARGIIVRRPHVMDALDRLDADRRAVRRMQALRDRHGPGPVRLALPWRDVALVLDPADMRRVLGGSPAPFAPASREKRAALGHFQPHGVLVSAAAARPPRRELNEAALDTGRPVHRIGAAIAAVVARETDAMIAEARARGVLDWNGFAPAFWRIVRRVVLGDGARDDTGLTDELAALRRDANWAFLRPRREGLRRRFQDRLEAHLARAEPGSLAAHMAQIPVGPGVHPAEQVPQWLFAFDAAGMATLSALALLDAHPAEADAARAEAARADLDAPDDLSFLRACVLDAIRLWPTTPAVLRDTDRETTWASGTLPANAALVVLAPFFHRDDRTVDVADRFAPEVWVDGDPGDRPFIPFSAGPVTCPGRDLVGLVTSLVLARLVLAGPRPSGRPPIPPGGPVPRTLSPFRLRFSLGVAAQPA